MDQSFVAPADGFIKGISVGLTTFLNDGIIITTICINGAPVKDHDTNAGGQLGIPLTGTWKSYEIYDPSEVIPIYTGDIISCWVETTYNYDSAPQQQIQTDLFMEFAELPPYYWPPSVPPPVVNIIFIVGGKTPS